MDADSMQAILNNDVSMLTDRHHTNNDFKVLALQTNSTISDKIKTIK